MSRWKCVLIYLACACSLARAQNASLAGLITDPSDAVVVTANVTVQNKDTGARHSAQTNSVGLYSIASIPPGNYQVVVQAKGFRAAVREGVLLEVAQRARLDVKLEVGAMEEKVTVTGEISPLGESAAVGMVVDRQFVQNLPLNGRSLHSLILLAPGVVPMQGRGLFSVNGQRTGTSYFTIDGVSANTGVVASRGWYDGLQKVANGDTPAVSASGVTTAMVSVDALEEFRIQTSTYAAEYGRQPGAQVQLLTRSGTNQFHGSAYEYLRNEAFDANDWFANSDGIPRQVRRQNQFGGTLGGPVYLPWFGSSGPKLWSGKNRTFFFASYETQRLRIPAYYTNIRVPSLRLREIVAPSVRPFLNAYPLPAGPEIVDSATGELTGNATLSQAHPNPTTSDATSIRVDHMLNSRFTLFGRYNYAPSINQDRFLNRVTDRNLDSRGITIGATMILTPRFSNELRFNYTQTDGESRETYDTWGGAVPLDPDMVLGGYTGPGRKLGYVQAKVGSETNYTYYQYIVGDLTSTFQKQFNLVNNAAFVLNRHRLKVGVDYRRLAPTLAPVAYQVSVQWNSTPPLLSGVAESVGIQARKEVRPRYDNISSFVQDTWRVSPRLTLDLGVRWEINPSPGDANGGKPILLQGIRSNADVVNGKLELAPPDTPIYNTFWKGVAPRIGAAYQLTRTPGFETVARAGFGSFFDLGSGRALDPFGGYPFTNYKSHLNVPFPVPASIATPPPFPELDLQAIRDSSFYALNPDLKLPYSLHWNVAIQQSLGRSQTLTASYVASAGRRLLVTQSLNNSRTPPTYKLNPDLPRMSFIRNGPTSDYHSLQVQFQRRLSRGFQAIANYTWAHAIDEISIDGTAGEGGTNTLRRGNANFDVRHSLSVGTVFQIPGSRSSRWVSALTRGWSLDSIFGVRSALPVDIEGGGLLLPDGQSLASPPDYIGGVPQYLYSSGYPGGRRINPAAVAFPPRKPDGNYERLGNLGRNVFRGFTQSQIDLSLQRHFRITETLTLQFRADAFNILNHPNFGSIDGEIDHGADFGLAWATSNGTRLYSAPGNGLSPLYAGGGPRSTQLSLRIAF